MTLLHGKIVIGGDEKTPRGTFHTGWIKMSVFLNFGRNCAEKAGLLGRKPYLATNL
jgi:hypothetical protein